MGRPSKTAAGLKRHATKEELAQRQAAEKALLTGVQLKEQPEVAANPAAHKEFGRVLPILAAIHKDDALYENVINRYCLLRAECEEFQRLRMKFMENLDALEENDELESAAKFALQAKMQKAILDADNRVQTERKMMFDIEKECAMTVASALRSVPKNPAPKENPLMGLVSGG